MTRRIRRGHTILQMIGLAMIIAAIAVSSGQVLKRSYQSHRNALDYLARSETLSLIYNRMYQDCSQPVVEITAGDELIIKTEDVTIRYQQQGQELKRVRYRQANGTEESGDEKLEILGVESWQLSSAASVEWQAEEMAAGFHVKTTLNGSTTASTVIVWKFLAESAE